MRRFFRALEQNRVRYLLISGQAAVLYGASTFSEDVDIWVDPAAANWGRLLAALESAKASIYKLTPPLEPRLARQGHGFHFTIPADKSSEPIGYLDVMGKPPRVGSFRECSQRALEFATAWGKLRVLSPRDLVLVKRTRRLGDYAVISALVHLVAAGQARSRDAWKWAIEQSFDAEELLAIWRGAPMSWRAGLRTRRPAVRLLRTMQRDRESLSEISALLGREMEQCREADRQYWTPIIAELRELHRSRKLLPEGEAVTAGRPRRE